ncbi:MAG: hypothetical protein FWF83_08205 [Clostridiales bacterium]|nr:hypothetical protein [Clostridiales bacterium]
MPILDISSWFIWKTKEERQRETEEYTEWAFPYGERQRENLTALLASLFPPKDRVFAMVQYLTCRELYEKELKATKDKDDAIDRMINTVKKHKRIIRPEDMVLLMALVLTDEQIDERVQYPSAETIRERAIELNLLRKDE